MDWPEDCLGPCVPENGASESGQFHNSAVVLPGGPYQHLCFSRTATSVGTELCAESLGKDEVVCTGREQESK